MTSLRPQSGPIAGPEPSVFSRHYWDGCAAGELRFQRCGECDAAVHTPAAVCSSCGSPDLHWEVSSGRGSIHSLTIVWRPATPAFEAPYAPAIIELEEGWFLLTSVIDCDTDAEELAVGAAVEIVFHPLSDGFVIPYASLR